MLDFNAPEFLVVAVVALLVIGPKDLPKALRLVGKWVGKARGVARQFRSGFDTMVRESELADLQKQWALENERIMRDHPPVQALPAPDEVTDETGMWPDYGIEPAMAEQPAILDETPPEPGAKKPRRKPAKTGDLIEAPKPTRRPGPRAKAQS